jgi:hypothetical protein
LSGLKERNFLEELGMDGKIISKLISKKYGDTFPLILLAQKHMKTLSSYEM